MNQKEKQKKNSRSKIFQMLGVFSNGIQTAWQRHHFRIPLNMWKHYFKRLIFKLRFWGNSPYLDPNDQADYNLWLKNKKWDLESKIKLSEPKISFIIPVYNTPAHILMECIESVLNQSYRNIQVCITDDHSSNEETIRTLEDLCKKDDRIKIVTRNSNGHISCASNDAIALANGDYIALLDHDDVLDLDAALVMANFINLHPEADFIYSDEDKLDHNGNRCSPHFKPDYSPNSLLSSNYICHLSVIRRSLVLKVGGFREGYEGAQDHDLFLRISLETQAIYHIPLILYHWRMSNTSTSSSSSNKTYAQLNGIKAVESFLHQQDIKAKVSLEPRSGYYLIDYELDYEPLISIIIPTKDNAILLDNCLSSILHQNDYNNYEIIIIDNRSEQAETKALLEKYQRNTKNFKVINADIEFNYSKLNNLGVNHAKGEYILLLNNDTQVITKHWLRQMVGTASQKKVGAVGALLLYKDHTIQHGGVILGIGGVATHAFHHSHEIELGLYGRLCVPYNYSAVTAACLMVSKAKYNAVGGFEEKLGIVYNDVDFCLKLCKLGNYNVLLPQVKLFHFESKSRGSDFTSKKFQRYLNETQFMNDKWQALIEKDPFYNPNFTKTNCFLLDRQ